MRDPCDSERESIEPREPADSAWDAFAPRRMTELAEEFSSCRQVFIALGNESRQQIFIELLRHWGGMRVGELTVCVNLSRPAVSHHLKVLREAGLVDMYEMGTRNFYHVSADLALWTRMARLAGDAEGFVRQVARRAESAGDGCGGKRVE
ncbi:ArsR/SmtB family transcription factor [Collinsella ihumii]|uniref:Metalloregulator ArsR/SmtB family transcription factor n=1 Tax=Collinsella ihumii TaxID=1720204 RepID=A0ABT7XC69_9ACTN|nr:metalloregulator ArsR/SmtB family transcription factor [Collinsella ihumii]MDN0062986.1 metalloregulator ArsR/SmtB family transcription factor [Collinsella ihumii]